MSKQRRTLTAAITAVTLICTIAACSDDDDGDDAAATTAAESDVAADDDSTDGGSESDSGGDAGDNAEVEAYCSGVDELAEAAQQLIDDPTNADPALVSELTQELTEQAAQLAGSVGPDDADRLQECSDRFSEIGP